MNTTAQISTLTHSFSVRFLKELLAGDRVACQKITREYLEQNPSIQDLYEQVFREALYEVGRLWESNRISVAAEHLATAITEGLLNELFEEIVSGSKHNRKVVVACVESEQHQVGIKMVADVFEMHGWDSFFLGAGIPTTELIRYIQEVKPDLLAISLSVYHHYAQLAKMLGQLRVYFPDLLILLGGQAISGVPRAALEEWAPVVVVKDLYLLEKFIKTLDQSNPT